MLQESLSIACWGTRLLMEQELSGLREEDLGHRLSHGIEFNARSSLSLGSNKYSLDHVPLLTILGQQSRVQDQSLVAHMAITNTVNCSCLNILSRISARLWHAQIPKPKLALWMSCCRQLVSHIDALSLDSATSLRHLKPTTSQLLWSRKLKLTKVSPTKQAAQPWTFLGLASELHAHIGPNWAVSKGRNSRPLLGIAGSIQSFSG
jgi:hypothetical protein